MVAVRAIAALGFSLALMAENASFAAEPDLELHYTGTTWRAVGAIGEVPTDALVRIDSRGTYLAVTAVGAGQSAERPRPATNVESVGGVLLQSAAVGQPQIDAWFNINRYTGELVVASRGSGGKALFVGKCRKAAPLF